VVSRGWHVALIALKRYAERDKNKDAAAETL